MRGDKARVPEQQNAQVIDLAEARQRIAAELARAEREQVEQGAAEPEPTRPEPVKWGLFDAAREAERTGLLDAALPAPAPTPALPRAPSIVLREWRAETDRQFAGVSRKAERVADYGNQLLARHEQRRDEHRQRRPAEPTGCSRPCRAAPMRSQ